MESILEVTLHPLYTPAHKTTCMGQNYMQLMKRCRREWLESQMRDEWPSPAPQLVSSLDPEVLLWVILAIMIKIQMDIILRE